MDYVTEYLPLHNKFKDGYIISPKEGKPTLIIIEETLTAEERRKRLDKIVARFRLNGD